MFLMFQLASLPLSLPRLDFFVFPTSNYRGDKGIPETQDHQQQQNIKSDHKKIL
jgi:hypothetical protein